MAFRKGSSGVDPLRAELRRARRWHVGQKEQESEKRPERASSPPTRRGCSVRTRVRTPGSPGSLQQGGTERPESPPGAPILARARFSRTSRFAGSRAWGRGVSWRGRVWGVASGSGAAEGGCRAEGSGPRRREGRPSPGSGAPRWDWFLRSHFLSNQTADWRREPTRAALEVCVSLRPMIAPKPTPL